MSNESSSFVHSLSTDILIGFQRHTGKNSLLPYENKKKEILYTARLSQ